LLSVRAGHEGHADHPTKDQVFHIHCNFPFGFGNMPTMRPSCVPPELLIAHSFPLAAICRMLRALEIDVADVGLVPPAPDLQAMRCPSNVESRKLLRRDAIRNFLQAKPAVQEGLNFQLAADPLRFLGHVSTP
jgi:hypothetical protein